MPTTTVKCLQCGKTFGLKAEAPHKKFHSAKCRYDWHNARRKEAIRQLEEREAEARGESERAAE